MINQLTTLDVSNNTALEFLSCYNNQLTALDVSRNTLLRIMFCDGNQLATLDVSNNTALSVFDCSRNQLTVLDLSHNNTDLRYLFCNNNQLTASTLNDLFRTLHNNTSSTKMSGSEISPFSIVIGYNPGTSDCDVSIAQKKGWIVRQ